MSKKASNATIGAFVIGAIALLCLAVAVFGSGKLFKQTAEFVVFFDKSINGLNVGSPVVLQGVPIGRVSNIRLDRDDTAMSYRIAIYVEIDKKKVGTPLPQSLEDDGAKEYLDQLVRKGLRAQLAQQSLLTGQLMIELSFFPPSELHDGLTSISYYKDCPVIPSISSTFDTLLEQMAHVPLKEIAQNVLMITERVNQLLSHPDTQTLPTELHDLLTQTKNLFASVSGLSSRSADLATSMDAELTSVFRQLHAAINDVRDVINPTSLQVIELNRVLHEVGEAANAVRSLADMLNRHPESILQGRGIAE